MSRKTVTIEQACDRIPRAAESLLTREQVLEQLTLAPWDPPALQDVPGHSAACECPGRS